MKARSKSFAPGKDNFRPGPAARTSRAGVAQRAGGRHRLLILCPFPVGVAAGQRLKYEQYFEDWRALGFDITVSPFMDQALWDIVYSPGNSVRKALGVLRGHLRRTRDLARVGRFDLVYVFMWVTPFGTTLFERLVRAFAPRLIYDIEDNVLIKEGESRGDHPNRLVQFVKGVGKARFLVRRADHVITSSPFLNETCLALNDKKASTYISSSVDTDRFAPANSYSNEAIVTVGWTGTFSSKVYLDLLRPVLQRLGRERRFKFRVIGNFDYELPGVDLEVVRWSKAKEVEDLQALDIGVYPLPLDDWVTGKSGLKAIQYMAFGLPCVATDVATTPMIIRDGANGLLVRTEEEWLGALRCLLDDESLRRRLGEQARRDAVAKYSTHAIRGAYRNVILDVMETTNAE